jgi:pteridine reductase
MHKNVLITGAAKRIGAACAKHLHDQGCNVFLHYKTSEAEAIELSNQFNLKRANSSCIMQADLLIEEERSALAKAASLKWGGIDALINNASSFYPTAISDVSEQQWDELLGSNLKAPFFLAQALSKTLALNKGTIINIVDIHADRGLPGYSVYSIAKAGLQAMTKILAKEFAPSIRVNGVAPGAILWPDNPSSDQDEILQRIALGRCGEPLDIAKAIWFLINDADYMTGQILTIDGGRTLFY